MLLLPIQRMAAQSALRMQNYSHELSEHMVTDIRQDERGFLWFSTWNGLHRFDGYTFKNYKTYPGEECVMESNRILEIVEVVSTDPPSGMEIVITPYDEPLSALTDGVAKCEKITGLINTQFEDRPPECGLLHKESRSLLFLGILRFEHPITIVLKVFFKNSFLEKDLV